MVINWEMLGGALALLVTGAYAVVKGHAKSDGRPPEHRPLAPNETKVALDSLRDRIDRNHNIAEDERRDMLRQLSELERISHRIERSMDRICDRLDSEARIGSALAKIAHKEGRP